MSLLKKLVLASLISTSMLVAAPSAMAAGKVQNQTPAQVEQTLDDTITAAEAVLEGLKNNTEKDAQLALYKAAKQVAKNIQSNVVLSNRDRALSRLKKSRIAFKKGNQDKAIEVMTDTVSRFKAVKIQYHSF